MRVRLLLCVLLAVAATGCETRPLGPDSPRTDVGRPGSGMLDDPRPDAPAPAAAGTDSEQ